MLKDKVRGPKDHKMLGNYIGLYLAQTNVKSLKSGRGSGDIVTTLLTYAKEKGIIKQALVSRMSKKNPYEAEAFIANTKKEIISSAGSKYIFIPQNHLIKKLKRPAAVVGLPCQIAMAPKDSLKVGLFCGLNSSPKVLEYIFKKYNLKKEDIAYMDHRAPKTKKLLIKLKNGKEIQVSKWWLSFFFSYPKCLYCKNYSNHFADIAVGDAKPNWSLVITRTEKGEELFQRLIKEKQVKAKKLTLKEFFKYRKSPLVQKEMRGGFIKTKFVRIRGNLFFRLPPIILKALGKGYAFYIKYILPKITKKPRLPDPDLKTICENLRAWFKKENYRGIDPYFLDEKVFKLGRFKAIKKLRSILKPLHSRVSKIFFKGFKGRVIPKAIGLIIRGNISLYKTTKNKEYLEENKKLIDLLIKNRNKKFKHHCWGWPFEWGSKPRYPKDYPLAIVTAEIGHALMDHYEITKEKSLLKICEDIADFFIKENGYTERKEGICFHYTKLDKYCITNISSYVCAYLTRLNRYSKEDYSSLINRSKSFVTSIQNKDGSWHYVAPPVPEGYEQKIDNRHTGFILIALNWINKIKKEKKTESSIKKGYNFYKNKLFNGVIPKWSPSQSYPVDIHDVAQGIITAAELDDLEFTKKQIDFTLDKFFNGQDEFYYKLFKNGKNNKMVFFRWNQAWMYRALSLYLEKLKEVKK